MTYTEWRDFEGERYKNYIVDSRFIEQFKKRIDSFESEWPKELSIPLHIAVYSIPFLNTFKLIFNFALNSDTPFSEVSRIIEQLREAYGITHIDDITSEDGFNLVISTYY